MNCSFQKITNIVYKHLIENKWLDYVAVRVLNILRTNYIYTLLKQNILKQELLNIVNYFHENNIDYAIIKGFAIAEKVYYEKGRLLREFNDIDFLVPQKYLSNIKYVLENRGYIQGDYDIFYNTLRKATRQEILNMRMNSHQIYNFVKEISLHPEYCIKDEITIDVNFTLFEGGNISHTISTEEILNNKVKLKILKDKYFYTLSNEFFLIQLCYHLYKDVNYRSHKKERMDLTLLKFCDIREYILKYKHIIDWESLANIVNKHCLNNGIYFSLYFTDKIYRDLDIKYFLELITPKDKLFLTFVENYEYYFKNNLIKKDFNIVI